MAEGEEIALSHIAPLDSMSDVRKKIYGNTLEPAAFLRIIQDITASNLSNIQLSAFLTACVGDGLNSDEVIALTKAGELHWAKQAGSAHRYARWNNNLLILGPDSPLSDSSVSPDVFAAWA